MDDLVLRKGIEAGIITAEQAERLRVLLPPPLPQDERLAGPPLSPDDEQLRLITSFSDIFVTLGIALFLSAIGWFASQAGGAIALSGAMCIASWLLAEFFTRKRRMALPSIVLLLIFSISAFLTVGFLMSVLLEGTPRSAGSMWRFGSETTVPVIVAGLSCVLLTALHYLRFRVPVTIAAGCAALIITAISIAYGAWPNLPKGALNLVLLICGLAVFALAMRFDIRDRERVSRQADIAFWLHLLAAPLIVHSLINGYVLDMGRIDAPAAAAIILIFLLLSLIAVFIDRRAMLVSGLSYAGYAFGSLIKGAGLSNMTAPVTLLVLGAFILLLSAGWRSVRGFILDGLPDALTRHLPPRTVRA